MWPAIPNWNKMTYLTYLRAYLYVFIDIDQNIVQGFHPNEMEAPFLTSAKNNSLINSVKWLLKNLETQTENSGSISISTLWKLIFNNHQLQQRERKKPNQTLKSFKCFAMRMRMRTMRDIQWKPSFVITFSANSSYKPETISCDAKPIF